MLLTVFFFGCAVIAACSIVLFARGWVMVRTDPPVPRYLIRQPVRRRKRLPKDDRGPLSVIFEAAGRPFARLLGNMLGPARLANARKRIGLAGRANVVTQEQYLARRAGAIIVWTAFGAAFAAVQSWGIALFFVVLGQIWVDLQLWALARERASEIEKQLPDFLDVLTVTVTAGLSFRRALARVTEAMPGVLSEEFSIALGQMELGTSRREAFRQLRDRVRTGSLPQLITAILQAEELGAPLADALVDISKDMRQNTAQVARRQAAKAVPRVSLISAFILVPAVLILFIGSIVFALFTGGSGGLLG